VVASFFPHDSSFGGALLRRFAHQMRILSTMEKMTQTIYDKFERE
jgi:hypothetical protein